MSLTSSLNEVLAEIKTRKKKEDALQSVALAHGIHLQILSPELVAQQNLAFAWRGVMEARSQFQMLENTELHESTNEIVDAIQELMAKTDALVSGSVPEMEDYTTPTDSIA